VTTARFSRPLALLVAGTFFMENLDGTIIATAAPTIAADFGVDPVAVNAAMTSYLLALAIAIQASGWLADRFGGRRIFLLAIVVFTLTSALCALSPNLLTLVLVRVGQGLGGALMVPVGRLLVLRSTAKEDLVPAIAYLTWPALVAPVVAPLVGGVITEYGAWEWVFLINVPLGALAFVVAWRVVPQLPGRAMPALDWVGFLLLAAAVTVLVLGLETVGPDSKIGAGRPAVLVGLAGAVLLGGLAVRWMLRRPHPLMNLRLLRIPTFRFSNSGGGVYRLVISAAPFLLPLLFQVGFGWSPVLAGAMVMALFVGNLGIKPSTSFLLRRFGFRPVLIGSSLGGALCFAGCALFTHGTPLPVIVAVLVASGAFRSVGFTAYNTVQFADVEPADLTEANTLAATVQQLAVGLGIAFGALAVRLGELFLTAADTGSGPAAAYRIAFAVLAVSMLFPTIESTRIARDAGEAVTGRGGGRT
jgi:EmrB/QacA subfamily drug resistance transporter